MLPSSRSSLAVCLLGGLLSAVPVLAGSSLVSHLLVPHFEVDTEAPAGTTVLWAVRNETAGPLTVTVRYFETDRATVAQLTEVRELAAKEIWTRNVRDVAASLPADPDGVARGWIDVQADGPMSGDYFLVTPGDAFASGDRMVDVDSESSDFDLCNNWVIRFLNGGAFSGGTSLSFWLDLEVAPTADDPAVSYTVYDEPGDVVFSQSLPVERLSFRIPAEQLVEVGPLGADFGALEIQFANGALGHVSGVMDASGLFSVGFSATCRD